MSGTTYTVSSGVTSSGITLGNGDIESVLSGGTAVNTTVNSD
jgi:autotransporter passenger strand-loop-strand repeat protein